MLFIRQRLQLNSKSFIHFIVQVVKTDQKLLSPHRTRNKPRSIVSSHVQAPCHIVSETMDNKKTITYITFFNYPCWNCSSVFLGRWNHIENLDDFFIRISFINLIACLMYCQWFSFKCINLISSKICRNIISFISFDLRCQ